MDILLYSHGTSFYESDSVFRSFNDSRPFYVSKYRGILHELAVIL